MIEWFFTGLENFKYITIRSVAIRGLYIVAIFLFINNREQYQLYWWMTVGTVIINALVNMSYVRKYVTTEWSELFSMRYMKSNITLGIYAIMTSMYLTFNVMYLGLVSDNVQVGYYTTAFKLYTVILGFFSAFTNVMLPRMSALLAKGDKNRFSELVDKSFSAIATFSIPMILCGIILAPQIIAVISGSGYEGAILPMRIIMPAILAVGIAQVVTLQILMPLKRDKVLLIVSIIGAVVSLIVNFAIVTRLQSVGSAIVLLSAELIVTGLYVVYIRRKLAIKIPLRMFTKELILTTPSALICLATTYFIENPFISLAVGGAVAILVWIALHKSFIKQLRR